MPLNTWLQIRGSESHYHARRRAAWMTKPHKLLQLDERRDRINLAGDLRRQGFLKEARQVLCSQKGGFHGCP